MSYVSEWETARERSKRFGLAVPPHEVVPAHRYLDDQAMAQIPLIIQKALEGLEYDDLVAQCLAIHYRLAPVIANWLKCPAIFTLGWIDDETEKGMFRFDDDFIQDKLRHAHQAGKSVNIHAWITLPSMEIIDVSLATTIGKLQGIPEMYGSLIHKYADDLWGMAYKPMLVGEDFLQKSGLLRKVRVGF